MSINFHLFRELDPSSRYFLRNKMSAVYLPGSSTNPLASFVRHCIVLAS